jgi:hypothetical protein
VPVIVWTNSGEVVLEAFTPWLPDRDEIVAVGVLVAVAVMVGGLTVVMNAGAKERCSGVRPASWKINPRATIKAIAVTGATERYSLVIGGSRLMDKVGLKAANRRDGGSVAA